MSDLTNPQKAVWNAVDSLYPPKQFAARDVAGWDSYQKKRFEAGLAADQTLTWFELHGKKYHTQNPEVWYEDAFDYVANSLGLGFFAKVFGSWAIKKIVKLMVEWLLSDLSVSYRGRVKNWTEI